MTLKFGMQHWVLKDYQTDSNDNHGLTFTYFMTRSNLVPFAFVWGEKCKTMDFSETIVVYDIKLVDAVNRMSAWSFKNIKGQGHSLTFVQGHSDSTFSNFFSLETPIPNEAKFHVELTWDGGMKVSTIGLCHMTKMAIMSIYG